MNIYPDSKVHGVNMGPIWGRQDPGGPHVGPVNFAIWVYFLASKCFVLASPMISHHETLISIIWKPADHLNLDELFIINVNNGASADTFLRYVRFNELCWPHWMDKPCIIHKPVNHQYLQSLEGSELRITLLNDIEAETTWLPFSRLTTHLPTL